MLRPAIRSCLVSLAMAPALAYALEVTLEGSFSLGAIVLDGIGVDEVSGEVFVHNRGSGITVLTPAGAVLRTLPSPGNLSNDFDLDIALRDIVIGGVTVPAGTLLAFNGDDSPERLYGLDPATGFVLASVALTSQSMVGGADVPAANGVVAIDYVSDQLRYLNPDTGATLSVVVQQLPFDINYGDVDYATLTDRLLLVSSNVPSIRELDGNGFCMRDIPFGQLSIGQVSGIALDETRGDYWLSSTDGSVYRVKIAPTQVDTDGDGVQDEDDNCLDAANPDQRDADADGIGNACDADLNNNCVVNFEDVGLMKAVFFSNDPVADLNGDGVVNFLDVGMLKSQIFQVPGPSGEGGPCGCGI